MNSDTAADFTLVCNHVQWKNVSHASCGHMARVQSIYSTMIKTNMRQTFVVMVVIRAKHLYGVLNKSILGAESPASIVNKLLLSQIANLTHYEVIKCYFINLQQYS